MKRFLIPTFSNHRHIKQLNKNIKRMHKKDKPNLNKYMIKNNLKEKKKKQNNLNSTIKNNKKTSLNPNQKNMISCSDNLLSASIRLDLIWKFNNLKENIADLWLNFLKNAGKVKKKNYCKKISTHNSI